MKKFFALFGAICLLLTSCVAVRRVEVAERAVTVRGSGSVVVTPNQAAISLSVVTRNADASAAAEENAGKMTAVQRALENLGVDSKSISTSNYAVVREMIYREGENIPGSYRVTNRLNVSVKNIDLVGKLIDAAIKAGANEMTSLEFSSSDTAEAAKQARGLAITQAKESAQLLAETAGSRLGPVLSITELQDSMPVPRPLMKTAAFGAAEAVADSTPVSANSSTVVITVEARFALY